MRNMIGTIWKGYLNLKLRNKFLLPVITFMFIALLVFTIYLINDQRAKSEERLRQKAEKLTYLLVNSNVDNVWNFNREALKNNCEAFSQDEELTRIIITDINSNIPLINLSRDIRGTQDIIRKANFIKKDRKIGELYVVYTNYHIEKNLENIRNSIIILFIFIFLVVSALISIVSSTALMPLKDLMEGVSRLTAGDINFHIEIRTRDELGKVSDSFNTMTDELSRHRERLEELVQERTSQLREANEKLSEAMKALWGEMELAKKIQTVLLPEKPEIRGYEIAASMEPADEVGGDYYDIISVAGYNWLVIGDVSGHGVPAGLVMMMVQTAIHTVLLENPQTPPSQMLSAINKTVYSNIEKMGESKHMTIVVLAATKDGAFSFTGLHEDILIRRKDTGKVEEIETNGMWIGIEPDISQWLAEETLQLDPGDCMILFTDGITEAMDKGGEFFGNERLIRIIEESGDVPASELHKNIISALKDWKKPDDVTLVVLKRS